MNAARTWTQDHGATGDGRGEQLSRGWLVETTSAWLKLTAPLGRVKLRNLRKVDWLFVFGCAGHNLMSPPRLIAVGAHNVRGQLRIKKKVAASKKEPQAKR